MPVVVKDKISRNAGHHYGQVRVQRVEGWTADSTVWTADTICITADGRIVCVPAAVVEPANAFDDFDAVVIAGSAAIDADLAEAAAASDLADAVSDLVADAIGAANALDQLDAVADVVAAVAEAADALDALDAAVGAHVLSADVAEAAEALDQADAVSSVSADAIEPAAALDAADAVTDVAAAVAEVADALDVADAAIGAQVLFGTIDEPTSALDQLDAAVEAAEVPAGGVVGRYYPPLRPVPVVGVGYGILPQIEGEAHGVVGVVGAGAGTLPVLRGDASGSVGVAGRSTAQLFVRAMATGAGGTRGSGEGVIVKFTGAATGRHDDDEAAVLAFLLAA